MLGAAHVSGVWQADGVRFTSNLGVRRDGAGYRSPRVSFHYQLIGNGGAYMSNLTAWDPTLGFGSVLCLWSRVDGNSSAAIGARGRGSDAGFFGGVAHVASIQLMLPLTACVTLVAGFVLWLRRRGAPVASRSVSNQPAAKPGGQRLMV